MYAALRRLLFRLDPERAHALALQAVRLAGAAAPVRAVLGRLAAAGLPARPVRAFGLEFPNPIGMAAGYDKDGLAWRGLGALGFGHVEVGTVTWRPQPGNPRPRLFRLVEDEALVNRMGFPGRGAEFVAGRIAGAGRPGGLVLGVNLGKNKDTPLEAAAEDYLALFRIFAPLADYLAVNVSSPNTEGLRRLQARDALEGLLSQLAAERASGRDEWAAEAAEAAEAAAAPPGRPVPILVKLAPDLTGDELDDALAAIERTGMDGVIAANTTIARPSSLRSPRAAETGGLSGRPLAERSTEMVAEIAHRTGGRLPIIGVGGIDSAAAARAKLDAGAVLVQVYTGLVYRGPLLARRIRAGLA